jgi:integrase
MRGNITRRGRDSWRLRFDVGVDARGKRKVQSVTVRSTKRQAQAKLTEFLAAIDKGVYVSPSKISVIEHVRARLSQWAASGAINDKTAERYDELIENQIAPFPIGAKMMQRLRPIDVEAWHTELRTVGRKDGKGGVSSRTIGHAHRILSKALKEAVKFDLAVRNAAGRDGQRAPKVDAQEVEIVPADKIGDIVTRLRGRAIYPRVIVALFTGMRRGEIVALRWRNVDLSAKVIAVRESIEETKQHGPRFKATKTRSGLRDISLPDIVVEVLTEHRRQQLEQRMAMGLGKPPADALVFPSLPDGGPQYPRNLSGEWKEACAVVGIDPPVTFHALRHSHASQLIAAGVDVVTVSKRLGHASAQITLQVYAHLWNKGDDQATAVINAAIGALNVTRS